MINMVAVVWLAVLAAAASFSPSALVATWLFIFWLMTMEIAWKPAENTGIRNRPISPQPSQVQNRHVGMPAEVDAEEREVHLAQLRAREERDLFQLRDDSPQLACRGELGIVAVLAEIRSLARI